MNKSDTRYQSVVRCTITLLFCILFLFINGMRVSAAVVSTGSCGDKVNWKVDSGNLIIYGTGPMYDYNSESATDRSPFQYKTYQSIKIEKGVTSVGTEAFYQTRVDSVTMANSVKSIGNYAFLWSDVKTVDMGDGVKSIGTMSFGRCANLTEIHMSKKLTSLAYYAFYGCFSLKKIDLPDGIKELNLLSFGGCTSLKELTIPAKCKTLKGGFFVCPNISDGKYSLTKLKVASGNKYFKSVGGVIYSKNGKTLLAYPPGKKSKSYTIASGTTKIDAGAFYNNPYITTVILPKNTVLIDKCSFNATNISNIKCKGKAPALAMQCFSGTSANTITMYYKESFKNEFVNFPSVSSSWYGKSIRLKKW